MLTEPLPITLDARKAAARGVSVSGTVKVLDLQRFRPLLAGDEGVTQVHLAFSRDEENRYLLKVAVAVDVMVTCQRCLEPMPAHIASENTLAIVWSDEQAAHLPRHLDPLIVDEEACNLWELVEDELILAMPPFSYHGADECKQFETGFSAQPEDKVEDVEKPNPFDVLAQLKPGNEH
jgi:uncharacterized protein